MTDPHLHYIQNYYEEPIPKSNPDRIIFPYDKKAKKFIMADNLPFRTQDRVHIREIETFLEQINIPLKKWHEDYSMFWEVSPRYCCLLIICFILLPLMLFIVCYQSVKQNKALKELREITLKSKAFVEENNQRFIERGLLWTFPVYFPRWIELWPHHQDPIQHAIVRVGDGKPVELQQSSRKPEIHTIEVAQNDQEQGYYSSVQQNQNQYNANMYNQNVYN